MQNRSVLILLGLLLASAVVAEAGIISSSRKLLQCNYRNNRNCNRRFDSTSAQLAANNRAIVNTQYAIRDAVESGANPYVTQGAANYGNDQAYIAANYRNPWAGWWYGYGKK